MIDVLNNLLPDILKSIDEDEWGSLLINRRKPHTYRIFRNFGEYRACLHVFDPCDPEDAFAHPHPWAGAFLTLKGEIVHTLGHSPDLKSKPVFQPPEILTPGSMYEIIDKQTWHKVQPTQRTHTVMINGLPWEGHIETRTTKGKDLLEIPPELMATMKLEHKELIGEYLKGNL